MTAVYPLIDVHMILLGDENPEWLAQCIQSLADEPVAVHFVRGQFGHIGRYRAEGFSRGYAPYVSYVDPDDYVLPGAFAACAAMLSDNLNIDAAWSGYQDTEGNVFENDLNHCVHRRERVNLMLPAIARERLVPERMLEDTAVKAYVGQAGYVYRNRPDSPAKRLLAIHNVNRGAFAPLEQ